MSEYHAPTDDIKFTMEAVAGLPQMRSLPAFSELSDDLVDAILEEAARFTSGVIAPLNRTGDAEGTKVVDRAVQEGAGFADAYQQVVEGGWSSLSASEEYGGQGLPELLAAGVGESIMSANMAFSLVTLLSQGSISALSNHGSDELKQRYLGKLVSGEWTGTMNLTEPQAGSDLGVVKTLATPTGDHYLLSGQKIFITWGDHQMTENIVHLVLARTPDAVAGSGGLSLFIVPKFLVNEDGTLGERNDVYPVSVEHKLGIHASPTCIMSFGDNGGAIGYLVGELNRGLAAMFTMMNHARLGVGLQGVGISERAYQHAVYYAKDRVQGGGQTIIQHPDVRRMLMQMRAMTEAGRALCYSAYANTDFAEFGTTAEQREFAQQRADLLTPLAKGWTTELANEVTSLGVQVHGGMGFIEETGAAQHYRDARILAIYEGTNGIQALDLIGRKLTRDGGKMMASLIADIDSSIQALKEQGSSVSDIHDALAGGRDTLQHASQWVLENAKETDLTGSVAFDYLMLSGYVTGAWMLSQKALLAQQHLANTDSNQSFLNSKLAVARFFLSNILPRSSAHWQAMQAGASTIMALAESEF
ncbi:MAG: acyl-CoA dehydrogenase [Pseudomonadales bacterium]